MSQTIELGLDTFGDVTAGADGQPLSQAQSLRNLVHQGELADQVGLAFIGVGEHHRPDFSVSAPEVVLAAIAARTSKIHLGSAVTVLSSDDPVRVFQDFATVDLLSGGRAEIMAGRGSFIESFPLFGYDLDDYDELFAEKLDLLLQIRENVEVTWSGRLRAPLEGAGVYPRPVQDRLPVWVAVGGTPQSVVRAGLLGLPLAIAIIGGELRRFAPLVQLYRDAAERGGHDPAALPVAINTHGFVGEDRRHFARTYLDGMNRIGRERGWGPSGMPQYEALRSPGGALHAGTAEEVAEKIVLGHELFGNARYLSHMSLGAVDHLEVLRSMERFGTEVAPLVRAELARRAAPAAAR